jgi:hypothetical protein
MLVDRKRLNSKIWYRIGPFWYPLTLNGLSFDVFKPFLTT